MIFKGQTLKRFNFFCGADPYNFGEEHYERAPSNPGPKYSYPNDAKSIQEIIKFLTDSKLRGRFPSNGLRLKGKVKNLDMNDPVSDMFPQEMRHETKYASTNPLEDFRMAGDPKEVSALHFTRALFSNESTLSTHLSSVIFFNR
jgi:hypothetical protein